MKISPELKILLKIGASTLFWALAARYGYVLLFPEKPLGFNLYSAIFVLSALFINVVYSALVLRNAILSRDQELLTFAKFVLDLSANAPQIDSKLVRDEASNLILLKLKPTDEQHEMFFYDEVFGKNIKFGQ